MKEVCKEKSNKKRIFFGFEIYHQKHFLRWKEIIIIKKLLRVENDKRGYFGTTNNHKDKNKY